jgi:hypothetical protein
MNAISRSVTMAEKSSQTHNTFKGKVPEDAREHFRAARGEFMKSIESIVPPEFMEHHKVARKEMLLAWKSLIDASLERMEKE